MTDVSLVYVPFGSLERPSLALGLLKAALTRASISSDVNYCNFDFAERVGLELYSKLAWVREEMIGEWIFSGAAFPDFHPNLDSYLESVLDSFFPGGDRKARQFSRSYLLFARQEADAFIEDQARSILNQKPRIVACSSTFNQNCAMLALTRRIKDLDPSVITVAGGANCESGMGVAMARHFRWLDYVASGEAELFFPELCQKILDRGGLLLDEKDLPHGVIPSSVAAKPPRLVMADRTEPPRAMVDDLEATPVPDFDDYFTALERYSGRVYITPGLTVETARGCWWGAMHHCTFCGLNGGTMEFRSKTPDRVKSELRELSAKYGINRFMMADNILDQSYYKELLPALATVPEKYEIYFEIKSNVTFQQLQTLKAAGVGWVVAGIESLHDDVLKLMDKGTWGWLNTQMLKWTRGLGIHVSWNMLCGLPGEEDAWYGEMAEWLPLISHLEPPNDIRIIRFDRFSPYQAKSEKYGLKLRPAWPYAHIYPLSQDELQDLVYFFEVDGRAPVHINPFRQTRAASGLPSLGGPGRDALQQRIHEWVRLYRSSSPAILRMTEDPDRTVIVDTRPVASEERVVLEGLSHRIHRLADRASTEQTILAGLESDGGPRVELADVQRELKSLVERKLFVQMGQRFLALAVRGPMPTLPWRNQDGYPGGWFVYPRPTVLPPGLQRFLSRDQAREPTQASSPSTQP
jgi:ribosomal peptide maturation radical SAM protein 1